VKLRTRRTRSSQLQSRLPLSALIAEAIATMVQRPGRAILTVLGTVLGIGALVAVVGLTATASGQISERFTVLSATEVVVEQVESAGAEYTGGPAYQAFPDDSSDRMAALNGVRRAGVWWPVDPTQGRGGNTGVSALPPGTHNATAPEDVAVLAVAPGAIEASRPHYSQGRGYDTFHDSRGEHVAVIGSSVAHRLGISRLDGLPAIFVDDHPFTVIGILDDVDRNAEFLTSVLIPAGTADVLWGPPEGAATTMIVETDIGAAQIVGSQAALALRPDNPELFHVVVPPDPTSLKDDVNTDLNALFLALAGVSLLIGTFGIANTTLVAVLERLPEIGLRRALGARPRHIASQFLTESAALGTLGGLIGTTLGIVATVAVAIVQDWSAIMPAWLPVTPILGTLTGLLAGLYPSWRATRIEPTDALRR